MFSKICRYNARAVACPENQKWLKYWIPLYLFASIQSYLVLFMVRQILKDYHVKGGRMDQHFLVDAHALDSIADAAELEPSDVVLEIGGGIGNLSERIAPKVSKLIIIELDPKMVDILKDRLSVFSNVEIIHQNVMETDFETLLFNKIVANLPYSISSDITLKILQSDFDAAVLMYQYEFAKRLVAPAGGKDYGRLSVHTQYKSDASFLFKVPKGAFEPAPKVDSAVIRLVKKDLSNPSENNSPSSFSVQNEDFFFDVTKVLFAQRRKKIKNTLLAGASQLNFSNLKDALDRLGQQSFTPSGPSKLSGKKVADILDRRAEELTPAEIASLSDLLYSKKTDLSGAENLKDKKIKPEQTLRPAPEIFSVTVFGDVYEPAEDTYLMARAAAEFIADARQNEGGSNPFNVLEIGCGSGFVSAYLLSEFESDPNFQLRAVDINPNAVECAKENGVSAFLSDLFEIFEDLSELFDLIVFNPPYLPTSPDEKVSGWLNYAFDGGLSGRETINRFLKDVKKYLTPEGSFLLLISSITGFEDVTKEMEKYGFSGKIIAAEKCSFEELMIILGKNIENDLIGNKRDDSK
ncbi:16S rRNA (adenine(1518)-N(6)/adenine(1519)-N(6))-dimethyltransferase RsmA [Methanolapillus millepedarum]|uniref:Probable ribosomal RNA small subunit methyltransferase A n=1 Tax=Methanolapillus millepedarum TaxID=3028296 RepID=A0AA96V3J2_9EURY|nr:Ribosomal RNA small subunit methyltransferase A [Methanosarcinaceae archaeon Ac7]